MPELADLVTAFRSVLPSAAGVVLASMDGRALAADVDGADELVREAGASWSAGASVLVEREGGPVLVVFLPDDITLFSPLATAAA